MTSYSHAYLDPGSGSILLQLLAFLASFILILWSRVKLFFSVLFEKIKNFYQKINQSKNKDNF